MLEIWKDIPSYEGLYQVSNTGRVKRLSGYYCRKSRILKCKINRCGYFYFNLCKNGIAKSRLVHHLVLMAFVSKRPNKMHGCHLDDNKSNNELSNLIWGTISDNMDHRNINGGHPYGIKNGKARLTEKQILTIRRLYKMRLSNGKRKYTQQQLAQKFGVTQSQIMRIINKKQWRHI